MRSPERSSFMGEHTAEFSVVAELSVVFHRCGFSVIPFFYWADREGGNMSSNCDDGSPIHILAVYPRRPKVLSPGDDVIEMKINQVIFEHARLLHRFGIVVAAAVPRVSSIWSLADAPACSWFLIDGHNTLEGDASVMIALSGHCESETPPGVRGPLTDGSLIALVTASAHLRWAEALGMIREGRPNNAGRSLFPFGGRYRPVYFAVRKMS